MHEGSHAIHRVETAKFVLSRRVAVAGVAAVADVAVAASAGAAGVWCWCWERVSEGRSTVITLFAWPDNPLGFCSFSFFFLEEAFTPLASFGGLATTARTISPAIPFGKIRLSPGRCVGVC